jgi:hypothetical protein
MLQTPVGRAVLLAAAALATAAPAALADPAPLTPQTNFATAPKIAGVTAAGGWTAWSEKTGSSWALKLRSPAGVVSAPGLAVRRIPFDASLGVRSSGAVVLAYSRCRDDPRYAAGGVTLAWYTARGCVLHFFDPVKGNDRKLAPTPGSVADVLPQVSESTLVYATIARRGRRASIVAESLPDGGLETLYTGPADRVRNDQVDAARGPALVAVNGGHVAFAWNVVQGLGKHDFGVEAFGINLYVVDRGRVVNVDAQGGATDGACGGYTNFTALTVTSRYAIAEQTSAVGWQLERVALTQPKRVHERRRPASLEYARGVDYGGEGYLPSTAIDGARLVLTAPAGAAEQVGESPLPAFGATGRLDNPFQCA